jgi:hypothetical protein
MIHIIMDNMENTEVAKATRNAFPLRAKAAFPLVIRSYQASRLFLVSCWRLGCLY